MTPKPIFYQSIQDQNQSFVQTQQPQTTQQTASTKSPVKVATTRPASSSPRKAKMAKADPSSPKTSKSDSKIASTSVPQVMRTPTAKRARTMTQHYQSPIPELELISKISKTTNTPKLKAGDEKLIQFYK